MVFEKLKNSKIIDVFKIIANNNFTKIRTKIIVIIRGENYFGDENRRRTLHVFGHVTTLRAPSDICDVTAQASLVSSTQQSSDHF